jgi:hypothetical protein
MRPCIVTAVTTDLPGADRQSPSIILKSTLLDEVLTPPLWACTGPGPKPDLDTLLGWFDRIEFANPSTYKRCLEPASAKDH